jgi:hypothetical protein
LPEIFLCWLRLIILGKKITYSNLKNVIYERVDKLDMLVKILIDFFHFYKGTSHQEIDVKIMLSSYKLRKLSHCFAFRIRDKAL